MQDMPPRQRGRLDHIPFISFPLYGPERDWQSGLEGKHCALSSAALNLSQAYHVAILLTFLGTSHSFSSAYQIFAYFQLDLKQVSSSSQALTSVFLKWTR